MKAFTYRTPGNLDEAVQFSPTDPDAKLLGGGTNLVDLVKLGVEVPGTDAGH